MVGEIGGDAEERAADFIAERSRSRSSPTSPASPRRPASRWATPGRSSPAPRAPPRRRRRRSRRSGVQRRPLPDRDGPARGRDARRAGVGGRARPTAASPDSSAGHGPRDFLYSGAMADEVISFARGAPSADILPADAVREAAAAGARDDWKRALSYGTGIGPSRAVRVDRRAPRASSPSQVMVTNGSLEAGAMLFQHLVAPGDRVIVEQPSYDRTLLLLGGSAPSSCRCRSRPTASTSRRSSGRSAAGPRQARPRDPQLPQPGRLHALGGEARAAGRAGGRARVRDLRGRPLPLAPLRGRAAADDALARRGGPRDPRVLVLEDGQPRGPRRLPRRARRTRSRASPSGRTSSTSRRTCWPSRSCWELCRSGGLTRTSSSSRGAARAPRRARRGAPRADPRGGVRGSRGRLLPLARPRRRRRHRQAPRRPRSRRASPSSPAPTSCSRAAAPACGSRSRASRRSRSPRASPGSPAPSSACGPPPRPSVRREVAPPEGRGLLPF